MTTEYDKYLEATDLSYKNARHALEHDIVRPNPPDTAGSQVSMIVIPVAVHVVYNQPEQNISMEQIISQIDAMNEDFNNRNATLAMLPDGFTGLATLPFAVSFRLAANDGQNPSEGITRTFTTKTSFTNFNEVKFDSTGGHSAWDASSYFNIWVCHLAGNVLGYAQYPGGDPATDGIVVNYRAFGRTGDLLSAYNLGRTGTHEAGHWLNLYHIWGDDGGSCTMDDFVQDTPLQADETKGCPGFPEVSCSNGPLGDLFMDYMDYTDDRCMCLFTEGQRSRMMQAFYNDRSSLLSSTGLNHLVTVNLNLEIEEIAAPANLVCDNAYTPAIVFRNSGTSDVHEFEFEYSGGGAYTSMQVHETVPAGQAKTVTLIEKVDAYGLHLFTVRLVSVNGIADEIAPDNFRTRSFLLSSEEYGCPVYPEVPEIIVRPNITGGLIELETKFKESPISTLVICDVTGKSVLRYEMRAANGTRMKLDVGGLADGIYFIYVRTFNQEAAGRFVVQH